MGMKFACRHGLCRRDLSCTKVNAVNRLRDGLEASFRLSGEAALPVAARPAHSMLGPGPNCLLIVSWENRWQVRWVRTKRRSSADWSGFEQVSRWVEDRGNQLPAGSAVFPRCISLLLDHVHSRQLVWEKVASPQSRVIYLLGTHGGQPRRRHGGH